MPLPPAALWALHRQVDVALGGTARAAATALVARPGSLLPRSATGAGASAVTDLLLFGLSMRNRLQQYLEGGRGGVGQAGWLAGLPKIA